MHVGSLQYNPKSEGLLMINMFASFFFYNEEAEGPKKYMQDPIVQSDIYITFEKTRIMTAHIIGLFT